MHGGKTGGELIGGTHLGKKMHTASFYLITSNTHVHTQQTLLVY